MPREWRHPRAPIISIIMLLHCIQSIAHQQNLYKRCAKPNARWEKKWFLHSYYIATTAADWSNNHNNNNLREFIHTMLGVMRFDTWGSRHIDPREQTKITHTHQTWRRFVSLGIEFFKICIARMVTTTRKARICNRALLLFESDECAKVQFDTKAYSQNMRIIEVFILLVATPHKTIHKNMDKYLNCRNTGDRHTHTHTHPLAIERDVFFICGKWLKRLAEDS